jgi:hypothetical protein
MKIFLDDIRKPTDIYRDSVDSSWEVVKNYYQFVGKVRENFDKIILISFDHDLADEHYKIGQPSGFTEFDYTKCKEKTGIDCAKWLIEYCMTNQKNLPEYKCHSFNPVGKENILSLLGSFERHSRDIAS